MHDKDERTRFNGVFTLSDSETETYTDSCSYEIYKDSTENDPEKNQLKFDRTCTDTGVKLGTVSICIRIGIGIEIVIGSVYTLLYIIM